MPIANLAFRAFSKKSDGSAPEMAMDASVFRYRIEMSYLNVINRIRNYMLFIF